MISSAPSQLELSSHISLPLSHLAAFFEGETPSLSTGVYIKASLHETVTSGATSALQRSTMQLSFSPLLTFAVAIALLPSGTQAHSAHIHNRRMQLKSHEDGSHEMMQARASLNDASFAQIQDPTTECTPYSNSKLSSIINSFPPVWDTADIVAGDTAAKQLWTQIQASGIIPAGIQPKGTRDGNRAGVVYNAQQDPDCDWTVSKCTTPKHPGLPDDIVSCPTPHTWGLSFDDGPNCSNGSIPGGLYLF